MFQITFVAEKPSATGKTIRVLLSHPDHQRGTALYAYIPVGMNPRKWDVVSATTVKVDDVETTWENPTTGETGTFKTPQRKVSFFGDVTLEDGPSLPDTTWTDRRGKAAATVADGNEPF
jgi:hypothetical protein